MEKTPCCIALMAHVDAGKTTLSEGLLYTAGARRALGRVDHGDAFLDTHSLERARGITNPQNGGDFLWILRKIGETISHRSEN